MEGCTHCYYVVIVVFMSDINPNPLGINSIICTKEDIANGPVATCTDAMLPW